MLPFSTSDFDEGDTLTQLGSDSSKFMPIMMTYDVESSQAATDTLALLTNSVDFLSMSPVREEVSPTRYTV